jgi:hypothetical protein
MENCGVLDSTDEPTVWRIIFLVDQVSATATQKTRYKIFTGFSEGTFKVLRNPEAEPSEGWTVEGRPQAVDTGMKGKEAGNSISSEAREKQLEECPMDILSDSKVAISALDNFQINSKLIWDC